MKIDLSAAPHRVIDLLRFLRQMGYDAHEVSYGLVEVDDGTVPDSAFGVAAVALALRVRVWNVVNGAEARIVDANGLLEPPRVRREERAGPA
jgi:hypothetical protein